MSAADITGRVIALLTRHLGLDGITLTDTLGGALGADSLDMIEIIMALEQDFEFEASDAEIDALGTVADLIALVERKVGT